MKLRLILDFNTIDDCPEEGSICVDDVDYCSDNYHRNNSLPHENKTFYEEVYNKMSKYFKYIDRDEFNILVEVPDEAMFQYMIDGVYDYDYIAYNIPTGKICIAKSSYQATRYGDERYTRGMSNGREGSSDKFFTFSIDEFSEFDKTNQTRPDYMIIPDGEHYNNIKDAIYPYVVWQFTDFFKKGSECIKRSQLFPGESGKSSYGYDDDVCFQDHSSNNEGVFIGSRLFDDDEKKCKDTWHMRIDFFQACLQFWMEDHELFQSSRKFISDAELESYKRFHNKIMSQITETK